MASGQPVAILDPLRRLIDRQAGAALNDTELLENFVARRDPASFEVVVWRHGAMVLALCNRVLRDAHEAEDAFQATFLVFARKAASIGRRESVGCWLYKVAYRIALRLRAAASRRPASAEPALDLAAPETTGDAEWRDLRPILDDEIARLPEKYRAPFVLCYLEGRTNEEAAAQLGCPKGTILSRLSRGRERLRARLMRRGVALSLAALATTLTRNAAIAAAVPAAVARTTTNAAIPFATGTAAAELVPAHVAALTRGALHAMTMTNVKMIAASLLALVALGAGIGWAASSANGTNGPELIAVAEPQRGPRPQPDQSQRETRPPAVGMVTEIAADRKSFTIEVRPQTRGEETAKIPVKFGEKTSVTYNGVGSNGATPTIGFGAQVQFEEGSKEIASGVVFTGPESGRQGPDIAGKVVGAGADDKSVTLEIPITRGERGAENPRKITVAFDDKTVLAFTNVGPGEAKPAEGQIARIWYDDDARVSGNRIAGNVVFVGSAESARRDEKRPDATGKVVRSAADGTTFVVEVLRAARGEEPSRVVVKTDDKTTTVFNNVGRDEAITAVGLQAQIWFADNSKELAAKVSLTGLAPERWTVISGKVISVSKDGATIIVEQPFPNRGGTPPRTEIKLIDRTKTVYFGIGPGEARPAVGLEVRARLLDGSKDTASLATFSKPTAGRGRPEE